ncbi:hypothetical protein PCYB_002590 [Plasmodium cynomolgi strain B]|uniref:CYIR protein n=1 Tax=Plasmodium cynomolgi (strain B) TaxID=1120755 RepID=K6V2N3_PLACD|nr:hypothetical protein PCYB_002590 [Plasmodium cynomolgi strain B]GAB69510.1 hypothetical protein PCYB_002590 [Plasmodium cynomolgi strain B]
MAHETFEESKILSEIELSYLPSQKFYNEIKIEHKDLTNYSTHCDSIKLKDYEEEVKGICKKYLRYLEKSPLWYISNSEFDVCKLLNYWIYDTLTNIFGDKNTSERIGFAFSTLQYIWEYTVNNRYIRTYYKNCKPDYDIVKHPDWKKRKELYEYYVDYTTIKGISDINMSIVIVKFQLIGMKNTNILQKVNHYIQKRNQGLGLVKIVLDCYIWHIIFRMKCQPLKHPDLEQKLLIQFLVQHQFY